MDIDDLAGTLSAVTTVLRPGGWFVASIVHSCCPGTERGRSSGPPGQGYESEGWPASPDRNPAAAAVFGPHRVTGRGSARSSLPDGHDCERER